MNANISYTKTQSQHRNNQLNRQGRIIHEAGEAEDSGPGPRAPIGARTARYNENLQSRTTLGPEISRENLRAF